MASVRDWLAEREGTTFGFDFGFDFGFRFDFGFGFGDVNVGLCLNVQTDLLIYVGV